MRMYKVKKFHEKEGIMMQDLAYTQMMTNPTAVAAVLIQIDNLQEGEMLEIVRVKENDT